MDSNLSGTAFLISNSNCLLLMYKKAMVFWKLKQWSFCPRQTWYNHLLVSVSFFDCWFFGIFYREIISSVNNNSFITYFPICVPFISFSYPILLSRTSTVEMQRCIGSMLVLFLILAGKHLVFLLALNVF